MTVTTRLGGLGGGIAGRLITVNGPVAYAAGGFAVSASDCGLGVVVNVLVSPTSGYVGEYVPSTGKILVRWVDTTVDGAALAEVAEATDLSSVAFIGFAFGRP